MWFLLAKEGFSTSKQEVGNKVFLWICHYILLLLLFCYTVVPGSPFVWVLHTEKTAEAVSPHLQATGLGRLVCNPSIACVSDLGGPNSKAEGFPDVPTQCLGMTGKYSMPS